MLNLITQRTYLINIKELYQGTKLNTMSKLNLFKYVLIMKIFPLLFFAQKNRSTASSSLSEFMMYEVQITNPTLVSFDSLASDNLTQFQNRTLTDYLKDTEGKYFNLYQSKSLLDHIKSLLTNKKVIFFDGECGMTINKDKAKSSVDFVDSIKLIDQFGEDSLDFKGNALYKLIKEDYYHLKTLSKIRFYEEWKINHKNGSIEKNILGYSLIGTKEYGGINYELCFFGIAKDKDALRKIGMFRRVSSYCDQ